MGEANLLMLMNKHKFQWAKSRLEIQIQMEIEMVYGYRYKCIFYRPARRAYVCNMFFLSYWFFSLFSPAGLEIIRLISMNAFSLRGHKS